MLPRAAVAAAVVAAIIVIGLAVAGAVADRSSSNPPPVDPSADLPGELTDAPPWPANAAQLRDRLAALGLPALTREGTAFHIHAHLDVFVAGRLVVVPAGIGIDPAGRFISPLHTHDATGVIHVESPTVRTFTLGDFFGVWGVRFGGRCLGGYCAADGRAVRVYADGQPVARPGRLALAQHQEIVVTFGTRRQLPRPLPTRYAFPPGL